MPVSLMEFKDLLMPLVWLRNRQADILISYINDSLVLLTPDGIEHELLTRNQIDENIWREIAAYRIDEHLGKPTEKNDAA